MLPAFLSQPSLTRRLLLTTLVPLVMAFDVTAGVILTH